MSKTYVVLHTGDDMLEYYEDETAYLEEGGLKGPSRIWFQIRESKTSHTDGVDKSNDGYHFTIENIADGN